ncbi:hypothetical protein BZ13_900 [Francisella philomiragia subsp. philomiragia ATCC 25015]|uniref:DUF4124 domain-containing protein n=1 Tax=Francisella philomiragia TaxID=28110 RepID=UPI0001AF76CE|nr:DUF4124 domain-containing protein [Francisella philomiragia]AJI74690.1 hypothetical protein BZ13_900 [Francisella philomiragia subsp. philomiragia ATCC 25015]EET20882.1 conserved hypothetical protein [Francisella philomiragia subsp. philomiragia ATCC 25015]MBK2238230.1 DUF4124 domain-containing protein [Francisella philomiragia]
MSNFHKIILLYVISCSTFISLAQAANPTIYSWRSENGNVVFSEEKPSDDTDYKIIEVGQPTVVDTKASQDMISNQPVKIKQSDISKLNNSSLAEKNKEVLDENQGTTGDLSVQITSPANDANIFTKEDKLAISTNPAISADDKPTFIVNGTVMPATFEDDQWKIARPTPGENKLTIAGQTAAGNQIKSTNEVTFYIKNGWLQQAKNTGNYAGK